VGLEKFTAAVAVLLHTTWLATGFTTGVGFTVIVKVIVGPGQPLAIGVTVIVATSGALVLLVAMKLGMSPLPAGARPMAGLSFVQLNTVPATGPVKCISDVAEPLQSTWFGCWLAVGVGFTSTVAVMLGPGQPLAVGIMVNVTNCGMNVLLVSVPAIGVPLPDAAIPVTFTRLSLVHVKVVPATSLVSTIGVIADAEQIVCEDGVAVACGVGLTVIVNDVGAPVQVTPALV
jgi:hypothetical protein